MTCLRNARDLFRPRGTVGFPKFRFEGILPKMIFYSFVKSIIIILCNAGLLLGAHHIVQTVHVWVGDTPPHITQVTLSPSINLVYKCMHNLQFVYMCDFQKLMNYVFTSCVQSRHTKCTPTYDWSLCTLIKSLACLDARTCSQVSTAKLQIIPFANKC